MKLTYKKNMIHVFDDDKFIDVAIRLIEYVKPNESRYFVVKNNESPFQYVKSDKVEKISLKNEDELIRFADFISSNCEVLFLHALNEYKQKLALLVSKKIIKVWFVWGYDLYNKWPLLRRKIYEAETQNGLNVAEDTLKKKLTVNDFSFYLFKKLNIFQKILPKRVIHGLKNKYETEFWKAIQSIDIVVPVIPNEVNYVKKINPNVLYAPFTYGSIEDLLGDKIGLNVLNGKNVLIGNSADPSNNHLDIFSKLSKIHLGNRKVFVPLSYGGNEFYKSLVIKKGQELFGDNFVPLINFMALEKYNEILLSCGTLIFNHVRQQGVGNIIIMGYLGAKIYLNPKSPVYGYYKDLGMHINSLKKLDSEKNLYPLTKKEVLNNKKIFFDLYSKESVLKKVQKMFEVIEKNKK